MGERPAFDPLLTVIVLIGAGIAGCALFAIFWLFVSVVFLGGGTSCPQNLC